MARKKQTSPFDLSNMFTIDNKDFGFSIDSSFIDNVPEKRKQEKINRKRFLYTRQQAIKNGSMNPVYLDMRNPYKDIF